MAKRKSKQQKQEEMWTIITMVVLALVGGIITLLVLKSDKKTNYLDSRYGKVKCFMDLESRMNPLTPGSGPQGLCSLTQAERAIAFLKESGDPSKYQEVPLSLLKGDGITEPKTIDVFLGFQTQDYGDVDKRDLRANLKNLAVGEGDTIRVWSYTGENDQLSLKTYQLGVSTIEMRLEESAVTGSLNLIFKEDGTKASTIELSNAAELILAGNTSTAEGSESGTLDLLKEVVRAAKQGSVGDAVIIMASGSIKPLPEGLRLEFGGYDMEAFKKFDRWNYKYVPPDEENEKGYYVRKVAMSYYANANNGRIKKTYGDLIRPCAEHSLKLIFIDLDKETTREFSSAKQDLYEWVFGGCEAAVVIN